MDGVLRVQVPLKLHSHFVQMHIFSGYRVHVPCHQYPHFRHPTHQPLKGSLTLDESKRLKGTFGVTVRRWLEVSGYIWEDFLEEVNFSQKAKLSGEAEI